MKNNAVITPQADLDPIQTHLERYLSRVSADRQLLCDIIARRIIEVQEYSKFLKGTVMELADPALKIISEIVLEIISETRLKLAKTIMVQNRESLASFVNSRHAELGFIVEDSINQFIDHTNEAYDVLQASQIAPDSALSYEESLENSIDEYFTFIDRAMDQFIG